ncbi:potassium transporter TrkA [bacterium CPR1]|nr:potassium transporter TrkA [bacterium CPR1]
MRKITSIDRFRYFFDNTMARGPAAMIGWLGLVSLSMVVVAATVVTVLGINDTGFIEELWQGTMHAIDAGTLAGDQGWSLRLVMAAVTVGGIFIVSTLIGILSSGLESKLDELRKGRSFVIEEGHTLILGWSSKIFTIISELTVAQESEKSPCVVVLADKDKVEMEDEIRSEVGNLRRTRVICRSGNPNSLVDLDIVNPYQARSIIVLSPEEGNADSQTIKTILAVTNNPDRRPEPYHIVAEIKDERNLEVARMVGKNEVELLLADDLVARVMVQTCRQSGLSVVYTELMDFEGAEIYMRQEPSMAGRKFGEALFAYPECTVLGLQFADGRVKVNPPMDTVIATGDKLIVIAEDDSTLRVGTGNPSLQMSAVVSKSETETAPERALLLGWNERARILARELDRYVPPGSFLKVVSTQDVAERVAELDLKNTTLEYANADTTDRRVLDSLDVASYDHLLLLCYKDHLDLQEADAQTLVTLLHLRNISEQANIDLSIVSEMLDVRNRELAEVTKADDFIVSDKIVSLLMSQVSENKHLMRVFEDLFNSEGSEIYVKPASDYLKAGSTVTFATLVEAARLRGQVAIGYRNVRDQFNASKAYGIVVNPPKSRSITLGADDRVIVIAED